MEPESSVLNPDTAIVAELPEDNLSLDDFTAKINGAEPATAVAEPEAPVHERHRSKKQRARAGDVSRIGELTRRLRETEAERDALKGTTAPAVTPAVAASPVVPVAAAPTVSAPVARPAAPLPPVKSAETDPKPDPTTFEDVTAYWEAVSRWGAREELRAAHAAQDHAVKAQAQAEEVKRLTAQWNAGIAAAKQKYPDFEQIAYAPTQIPKGSLVDAWILEHKSGPLVLYSLQKNPTELHAMLALPLLDQVEALTLLAQRLSGSPAPAVVTGAAARPVASPVSRPPTPVRTGAMRAADSPPDPEAVSLSEHTKYYGTPKSRRARE